MIRFDFGMSYVGRATISMRRISNGSVSKEAICFSLFRLKNVARYMRHLVGCFGFRILWVRMDGRMV